MILGIPAEQLVPIANFVGLALLGLLAMLGLRFGRGTVTPAERQVEVAGALIDNSAVKELAASIEGYTMELIAGRADNEKQRQAMYRLIEVGNRFVDEVGDLRRDIGDLAKEIARSK
ncbi:hypothetical protein EN904_10605 [Mesorhizobium sp. M7A.F.Ca.CA.001.07.2.1]|uniref:hypothetical protein n=1 Tax=Mesorhizobium TaxID=68287 RepID=UPI000FCAF9D7|nr:MULTISPECIES: hypothetical protein [Mesorhizobium]RVB48714.1 hypothetical protein EN918_01330 [Mesorhizobium sp. M7A.F.Ca.CA.004.05.1.1]MCF6126084.1 hypothetical protein [Mesorhizobium ciceri]MCQ8813881.1 hypothetical protein [Mesorhizobium sp. SEMIA396]RUX79330.1 hypothetical protein EN983_12585 [Mesorhizobium sp. M7A.F.Ca.CA.004.08.2.1]RUX89409.1 hypothetical protein EN982_02390 [Mesorhizobium sp. M7A.F.Ca.CA.004.08.1.1]